MTAMSKTLYTMLLMVATIAGILPSPAASDMIVQAVNIGLPNTVVIMMRGEMLGNEVLRLKAAVAEVPPDKRIVVLLDSPGGLTQQGFDLGRFFYDAKVITMIPAGASCLSACAIAFVGGRDPLTSAPLRILAAGGRLGFHNFRSNWADRAYTKAELEEISRASQVGMFEHLRYYRSVEAPTRLLAIGSAAKASAMNIVSEGDALELGIAVLSKDSGKLISPQNISQRVGR